MQEGDRFFQSQSEAHSSLQRIAARLKQLDIDYAVVGGMALFLHGYRRFTDDVDILVAAEDIETIHEKLSGLGYVPLFENSKNLRDTVSGVRIEFLISGQYPGDGRRKPVQFPDPATSDVLEINGIRCLSLVTLVELKLASGMSAPNRLRDLADVQELIRILNLGKEFVDRLDSSVQEKFAELRQSVQQN